MSFLPDGYTVPKSEGKFATLETGDNKFIVLGSVVLGWEYWNTDNKPVRVKDKPENPVDIGTDKKGNTNKIKHIWAIPVYNLGTSQCQILTINQKTVMGALQDLSKDDDWGDPILNYQINIKKSGQDLGTEYQVVPAQFKGDIEKIKQEYEESEIEMDKYFATPEAKEEEIESPF
jgi:hypothetical protein